MSKKLSAIAVTFVALTLAACGAGKRRPGNTALMNGTTYSLPAVDSDLAMIATVPKDTIGEELPEEGVGSIKSSLWKATLGGLRKRNALSRSHFPPGRRLRFTTCPRASSTHSSSQSDLWTTGRLSAEPKPLDTGERPRQTRSGICEWPD